MKSLLLVLLVAQDDASRALEAHRKAFRSADDAASRAAAVGHLAVKHPRVLKRLLELVDHSDAGVRAAVASRLGEYRDSESAAEAIANLTADRDAAVAVLACQTLGSLQQDLARRHAAALNRLFDAKDEAVAKAAALSAGVIRDRSSIAPLIEAQRGVAQKLKRVFQEMGVGGCDGG